MYVRPRPRFRPRNAGGVPFSPLSLFTSGVAGVWYDPSDINNYMAGLGPELVTNGSFSSSSNWLTTGNSSVSGGTGNLDGTAVAGLLYQAGIFSNGKCYQVEFDVVSITGTLKCWNNDGTTIYSTTTSGRKSFTYIHAIASSNFLFRADLGSNVASVDNVSVREVTTIANATLFQDSAGTTPVTAVEQPVGLMLDKSQGLVLGSELVTNGDFSGGTTGWTAGNSATLSTTGGKLSVVNGALALGQGRQTITTVAGKTYKFSVTFTSVSASRGYIFVGTFAGDNSRFSAGPLTTSQTVTGYFTAAGTSTYLSIGNADNSIGLEVQFDDVTVKDIAGNHASQATAASRPVLRARYNLLTYSEQFDNAAWTKNNCSITSTNITDPLGGSTAEEVTLIAGTLIKNVSVLVTTPTSTSTISLAVKAGTNTFLQILNTGDVEFYSNINMSTGVVGNYGTKTVATSQSLGNGWYRFTLTFTPGTFGSGFRFQAVDSNTAAFNAATSSSGTFYLWGADLRTGSSAGTYQRIAAATDYATAGFLPYLALDGTDDSFGTNSINFSSTDEMTVCAGVTKLSDAAAAILVELSANVAANSGSFYLAAPEGVPPNNWFSSKMVGTGGPTPAVATSALFASPITVVFSALGDISTDTNLLRLNGTQVASNTSDQGTGNFGNYPLYIGRRANTSLPFNGRIYSLLVVGKTLSASELAATESWVAAKTGVSL